MSKKEITEVQMLASMIRKSGTLVRHGLTVQRSHRFPPDLIIKIENISKMSGVKLSIVINQLIEVGIESLYESLNSEEISNVNNVSHEQLKKYYGIDDAKDLE